MFVTPVRYVQKLSIRRNINFCTTNSSFKIFRMCGYTLNLKEFAIVIFKSSNRTCKFTYQVCKFFIRMKCNVPWPAPWFDTYIRWVRWREWFFASRVKFINHYFLSLIHISEPTRQAEISYAVFCLKKKKK